MCCGAHFFMCRPSRDMHILFLVTLVDFKTRPQSYTETSADLSTEFAELYDIKFPAVLQFFSSICWRYIACPLQNFPRSPRPNAWSAQEFSLQNQNLALPNLPSSPRQNDWSTLEFSETKTNLVLRTAALVCKQRSWQKTTGCRNA
jgi:hypothetical protein